jgi:hypothetical protein
VLIALFMIDDVLIWIKSPYLLVPFILVVLLVVALISLSKGTMLEPLVKQFQGQVTSTVSGVFKSTGTPGNRKTGTSSGGGANLK